MKHVLLSEHYLAPVIRDWCTACRRYELHFNGYIPGRTRPSAIRCQGCALLTAFR